MGYRICGKQKTLAFGIYPTVSLAEARHRRDAAKKYLADGVDPSVQRKLDKRATVITFRLVAEELLAKMQREPNLAAYQSFRRQQRQHSPMFLANVITCQPVSYRRP